MKRALDSVNERILAAVQQRPTQFSTSHLPRLVAVSKLKPNSAIIEAYQCGQRHFGENYIQELEEKSNSSDIIEQCPDIKFHFIGHLQSNKVNKLLKVKNLYMIETIDSEKLANSINGAIGRHVEDSFPNCSSDFEANHRLKVLVQVNTSGEAQKNGVEPNEAISLADYIVNNCKWLHFKGIMTIGKLDGWDNQPNQDFIRLYELRERIAQRLSISKQDLELSMGMSGDFDEAITRGSTSIRVGTLIFGERPSKS